MKKIDIYDFDKTVIPFDSGSTFAFYCFLRHPYLLFLLPFYFFDILLFITHIIGLDHFKHHIFCFVRFINLEKNVKKFWDRHEKDFYEFARKENRERESVVISASPDFLLKEAQKRLGFEHLICTRHDPKTGTLLYKNCRNAEKVRRFYEEFNKDEVEVVTVYSDSISNDGPIFSLGQNCIHVHSGARFEPFKYEDVYGERE